MRVIVHIHDNGDMTYAADEPVELISVDERIPADRCYRFKQNGPAFNIGHEFVDEVLGSDLIGHLDDGRHPDL